MKFISLSLLFFLFILFIKFITYEDRNAVVSNSNAANAQRNDVEEMETHYRINRFKKSGKIAGRTIGKNAVMLTQAYDLSGKLIVETFVSSQIVEQFCYEKSLNQIFIASDSRTSAQFFACLLSYQEIVTAEGGVIEGERRSVAQNDDLTSDSRGKNLKDTK